MLPGRQGDPFLRIMLLVVIMHMDTTVAAFVILPLTEGDLVGFGLVGWLLTLVRIHPLRLRNGLFYQSPGQGFDLIGRDGNISRPVFWLRRGDTSFIAPGQNDLAELHDGLRIDGRVGIRDVGTTWL